MPESCLPLCEVARPVDKQSSMAAVRSLRVSVKPESASESDTESDSDRDARDPEPMEVEEGEEQLETIPVQCSLKELLPVS